jgi:hypothetical protein
VPPRIVSDNTKRPRLVHLSIYQPERSFHFTKQYSTDSWSSIYDNMYFNFYQILREEKPTSDNSKRDNVMKIQKQNKGMPLKLAGQCK